MHRPLAVLFAVDRRLRGQSPLAVVLVAQAALIAALAPQLLRDDTWLTLVAGRIVWNNGIPTHDALAVYTSGKPWIDEQWLAQLVFHAASSLGGLSLVFVLHLTLYTGAMALAMATARRRGASALSVLAITVLALFVAPWSWQPRAQSFAYPLFAGVLALLLGDRGEGRRRTLLVIPLLCLCANLHGSALVGAGLAVAYAGLVLLGRRRRLGDAPVWPQLLLLLSPLCLLVTPYGLGTIDYYAGVVGSSDIAALAPEWHRPSGAEAFHFALLAVVALGLLVTGRRRLAPFEFVVVLGTFGASLTAVRHFIWFALAAIAILPPLLPARARRPRAIGRWVSWASVAAFGAIAAALLAQPTSWYVETWPDQAARALVKIADEDPDSKVFVHGREADWLMWKYPSLEGRIAYDARLELLSPEQIDDVVRFDRREGRGWPGAADGYELVWINSRLRPRHVRSLQKAGLSVVYRDREVTLLRR